MTAAVRTLALVVVALLGVAGLSRRRVRTEEYVGVDHPSGELRLSLAPEGRFRLTLALWDPVVEAPVGRRELEGRWRRAGDTLELRAATRRLTYRRARPPEAGWVWARSDLPTFADGVALAPARDAAGRLTIGRG